eukprot:TRINITY_DN9367_c1_g1_i1.p1 TRINITY_DN9367_c1_g1~~TRINITY_DN9367_c1_g1_i1.p1  ORF type:complete len:336 (+),score=135.84 TRINITY_DN9367_c1_g1_i1:102-1109(+)
MPARSKKEEEVELMAEESRAQRATEERHSISTPYGPITVSVEEGCSVEKQSDKPCILTYHDIGTNHLSCFGSFFALDECQVFKRMFLILHIDAPGHEEGAAPMPKSAPMLTTRQLGEQVDYVVRHFGIGGQSRPIYGFGVGAGCNVLLEYAVADDHQKHFAGMALCNPSGSRCGWREWTWHGLVSNQLWYSGMNARVKRMLMYRHFTSEAIEDNEDLVESYLEHLDTLHPINVARYVQAYARRRDLSDELDAIVCFDVIHFAGGDNPDNYWHVKEINKMFELGKSQFMNIDECSGLVTEEGPHHLTNPIKYWLAGKGYLMSALDIRPERHLVGKD